MTKLCTKCKIEKELPLFCFNKTKNKHASWCRECSNKLTKEKQYSRKYRENDIAGNILKTVKYRAYQRGIDFNLEKSDIIVPKYCPVLGIELKLSELSKNGGAPYSYSLDRIDPNQGYIKGNVMVMSHLANSMKSNATKEQLLMFANWIKETYE
jgi:hypothetical protein